MITYKIENDLSVEEFRIILINSTLGERSPIKRRSNNAPEKHSS